MSWLNGEWPYVCRIMAEDKNDAWWGKAGLEQTGVYRLFATRESKITMPASIARICGIDPTGTLYIGQGKIDACLDSVVRTYRPDYSPGRHPPLSRKLAAQFSPDNLVVAWQYTECPRPREMELIGAYFDEFGELPPLNSQR